ncbi:MAG: hypothetical protein MR210_03475 [Erysipelotrichaceae bacterium]|nr:hypothetical protein [Erysipelotrichaceae bacterium]MDY5251262.1 hypothetical protein [Erysipelotrichaceae bacterium]
MKERKDHREKKLLTESGVLSALLNSLLKDRELALDAYITQEEIVSLLNDHDIQSEVEIILYKTITNEYKLRVKDSSISKYQLLDDISKKIGCTYLSDLRRPEMKILVKLFLQKQVIDHYKLADWNDALSYLTNQEKKFVSFKEVETFLSHWR